ncbi:MAG TPA: 4-(cytidine 5'-diphospho)-2-C-methyl-D-erythritol kinase [Bryobacteraceae bacterium]
MGRSVKLRSLAKINLDLRVLNKNADNFHELRTVFQTVSLADTIEVDYTPSRKTELSIDDPQAIPDNLILRAARATLDALRVKATVRFRLTKKIPMGGGLGGGSSNAAAVLLALPVLAGRALPLSRAIEIGSRLGSDVPFFLLGGTALALGRGTELYPLPEIAAEPLLILSTGLHIATGPAYGALGRSLTFMGASSSINTFQSYVRALVETRSAGAASALSANDFESAVSGQFPQLKKIQAKLSRLGAAGVRMTGSGSAVVAMFTSRGERERARTMLLRDRMFEGCRIMPAALVSRRSYRALWRRQLSGHVLNEHGGNPGTEVWPLPSRYGR